VKIGLRKKRARPPKFHKERERRGISGVPLSQKSGGLPFPVFTEKRRKEKGVFLTSSNLISKKKGGKY